MDDKKAARRVGVGLGMVAVVAAVASSLGFGDLESKWIAIPVGVWLAILVIRLALTVSPGDPTEGEQLLSKLTRWPGALLSAIGVGLFVDKYAPDGFNPFLWLLVGSFVVGCALAVCVVKVKDRGGAEPSAALSANGAG